MPLSDQARLIWTPCQLAGSPEAPPIVNVAHVRRSPTAATAVQADVLALELEMGVKHLYVVYDPERHPHAFRPVCGTGDPPMRDATRQLGHVCVVCVKGGDVTDDINLEALADEDLLRLRAMLQREMKRRDLPVTAGGVAEKLAIRYFNTTRGLPKLQEARAGTANVDANSDRGERYSIKCIQSGRKTGTIYPDRTDPDKRLFEYLLIVILDDDWTLKAIYEFDWDLFARLRSWDIRMNAWYIGASNRSLGQARLYLPST